MRSGMTLFWPFFRSFASASCWKLLTGFSPALENAPGGLTVVAPPVFFFQNGPQQNTISYAPIIT
jgi:hypothetical protein